jgi:hypothetical protein
MVPILHRSAEYKVVARFPRHYGELASELSSVCPPAGKGSPDPASLPPRAVTVKDKSLRDGPAAPILDRHCARRLVRSQGRDEEMVHQLAEQGDEEMNQDQA